MLCEVEYHPSNHSGLVPSSPCTFSHREPIGCDYVRCQLQRTQARLGRYICKLYRAKDSAEPWPNGQAPAELNTDPR